MVPHSSLSSRVSFSGHALSYLLGTSAERRSASQSSPPFPTVSNPACTHHLSQSLLEGLAFLSWSFNFVPCTCSDLPYWETSQLIDLVPFASNKWLNEWINLRLLPLALCKHMYWDYTLPTREALLWKTTLSLAAQHFTFPSHIPCTLTPALRKALLQGLLGLSSSWHPSSAPCLLTLPGQCSPPWFLGSPQSAEVVQGFHCCSGSSFSYLPH